MVLYRYVCCCIIGRVQCDRHNPLNPAPILHIGKILVEYQNRNQIIPPHLPCALRHVTDSFFAYRFVALLRNILTGIRVVKLGYSINKSALIDIDKNYQ
jgi:hypothetical protein